MHPLFPELITRKWDDDPLNATLQKLPQLKQKVDVETEKALHNWSVFHWSTRLKFERAEYHHQALRHIHRHATDEEEDALLWRLRHWEFDEFFFQLAGALETLLQEINALFILDVDNKDLNWSTFVEAVDSKSNEPPPANYLRCRWEERWLVEIRRLRNATTHRYFVPLASSSSRPGNGDFHCTVMWPAFGDEELASAHQDDERDLPEVCEAYLDKAHEVLFGCWKIMLENFPVAIAGM